MSLKIESTVDEPMTHLKVQRWDVLETVHPGISAAWDRDAPAGRVPNFARWRGLIVSVGPKYGEHLTWDQIEERWRPDVRVFYDVGEAGSGTMRLPREKESLRDYFEESLGRIWLFQTTDDDTEGEFDSPPLFEAPTWDELDDRTEWANTWRSDPDYVTPEERRDYHRDLPHVKCVSHEESICSWGEAFVPVGTHGIYSHGPHDSSEHYCGIGGEGYISWEG